MFVVGQRWSSDTEPELGLGLVVEVSLREVEVVFVGVEERRRYAVGSAPLHRVCFGVGDVVEDKGGRALEVVEVLDREGVLFYDVGEEVLPECGLADCVYRDRPLDRLWAGRVDDPALFGLRREAMEWLHRVQGDVARGFVGGRVQLIPHQFYIAQEVCGRSSPRVLLCDEVGLGKTIEALLILHRLLVSGVVRRALILVPDSLVHQWFVELYRRFNLCPRIIDAAHMADVGDPADAFESDGLVLCSLDWLSGAPEGIGSALGAAWDLLIVDEAHHLRWSAEGAAPDYLLVEALCGRVNGVLLLTATPEQLGRESHFARLRLLDPHRYHDVEVFLAESHDYEATAMRAVALQEAGELRGLAALLDRHGPGRVVFRNTRAAIKGFPERRAHVVFLGGEADARVVWLADWLREHVGRKLVLICRSEEVVRGLYDALPRYVQVPTAMFHEGLSLLQRDRSAAWFAEEDGARLLLCSEIGGEGRNFQFAHDLVLYDLPLNPEVIEQRIGRLDRIGQRERIDVWVPVEEGSFEASVALWYHEGLNAFEVSLPGGNETYRGLIERLEGGASVEGLIVDTKRYRDEVAGRLEAGRDRLMELHSYRPDVAEGLLEGVGRLDVAADFEEMVVRLFEHHGVYAEPMDGRSYLLKAQGQVANVLQGVRPGRHHVTFDRSVALSREDVEFFTVDHPAVLHALDAVSVGAEGAASVALWVDDVERGLYVECLFRMDCSAAAALQVSRFLSRVQFRVLMDVQRGEDVSGLLEVLDGEVLRDARPMGLLEELLSMREVLEERVEEAALTVADAFEGSMAGAMERAEETLQEEVDRLRYLSRYNDHIHEDEIEAAEGVRDAVLSALGGSCLRLDGVRVIVRGGGG